MKVPSAYKHNHLSAIAFNIRQLHIAEPGIMGDCRPALLPDTKGQLRISVITFTQIGCGMDRTFLYDLCAFARALLASFIFSPSR